MAYTQVSSLNSAGNEAFDKAFWYSLRTKLYYDQLATIVGMPFHGRGTHTFNITADLAVATTPLTETTDPDPVALSDSEVQVTLTEYGNVVNVTEKAEGQDVYDINMRAVNTIGRNAGETVDRLARNALVAGSNVEYVGQSAESSVGSGNIITSGIIRKRVARLRGDSAEPINGSMYYAGFMHPDVAYDIRAETGANNFNDPVNQSDASRRWLGMVGTYEGVAWIETPNTYVNVDGGATTYDTYHTLIVGDEALAVCYSSAVSARSPQAVRGPVVDSLERFRPYGWKWHGGYARFREESLDRIVSISSIGTNS